MRWPHLATLRPQFLPGIVVIWTLLAFLPVIPNDFVNWDDYRMFLDNPAHQGSWGDRFRGAWTSHRKELERAVELAPAAARSHDYLGRALSAEGRHQEAETHRRRAAELRGQPWPPAYRPELPPTAPTTSGAPVAPPAGAPSPRLRRV